MKYTVQAAPITFFERMLAPLIGIPIGLAFVYVIAQWMAPIPIEVYERKADPVRVSGGTEVTVSWTEVRSAECSSIVNRQLISADGKIINFEPDESPVRPVGTNRNSFRFSVPPLAAEGDIVYRVKSRFICNWVQRILGGPELPLQDLKLHYTPKAEAL